MAFQKVTLALFMLSSLRFAWSQSIVEFGRFQNVNANDKAFLQHLVMETGVRSKLDCARLCFSAVGCQTFTFTKGSPAGSCRGHSLEMTPHMTSSSSANSSSYMLREAVRTDCLEVEPLPSALSPPVVTSLSPLWGTTLNSTCSSSTVLVPVQYDITCQSNEVWATPTYTCGACDGHEVHVSGPEGSLTSPGYPGNYTNDLNCTFVVTLPTSDLHNVTVELEYNLEDCTDCYCDYVILNDDGVKYCGNGTATLSLSVSGPVWTALHFVTDYSIVRTAGFLLHYRLA